MLRHLSLIISSKTVVNYLMLVRFKYVILQRISLFLVLNLLCYFKECLDGIVLFIVWVPPLWQFFSHYIPVVDRELNMTGLLETMYAANIRQMFYNKNMSYLVRRTYLATLFKWHLIYGCMYVCMLYWGEYNNSNCNNPRNEERYFHHIGVGKCHTHVIV